MKLKEFARYVGRSEVWVRKCIPDTPGVVMVEGAWVFFDPSTAAAHIKGRARPVGVGIKEVSSLVGKSTHWVTQKAPNVPGASKVNGKWLFNDIPATIEYFKGGKL